MCAFLLSHALLLLPRVPILSVLASYSSPLIKLINHHMHIAHRSPHSYSLAGISGLWYKCVCILPFALPLSLATQPPY